MQDKVVLVTGASSGIGEALTYEFAAHGSRLVIGARNAAELNRVADAVAARGQVRPVVVPMDVTHRDDCERLVQAALDAYGQIDVVIANAGMTQRSKFAEADMDVLRRVFELNFWGALNTVQPALPHVLRSRGSIVGMSSIAGFRGLPGRTAYSGSKFALNGFLEVLRTELLEQGVHVLTACPGYTESKIRENSLTADGRVYRDVHGSGKSFRDEHGVMSAETCARHVYRAVVQRRRYLVLTTQGKLAVWLNKWWPALADRLVLNVFKKEEGAVV